MQKRSGLDSLRNSILSLPPRKKPTDWRIWYRLRRNITVYASSPKAGLSASSPGSSENYMIWKESTSFRTWDRGTKRLHHQIPSRDPVPSHPGTPPKSSGSAPQPQHRLRFSFSTQRNTYTCKNPQDQILKARINYADIA